VSSPELPDAINAYQHAHDRRDSDTALASFGREATVTDENATYTGTERIRWWLTNTASQYTYTRTLTGVDDLGNGAYVVHNHLSGDFPGNDVDLHYRFEMHDGLIQRLVIAP
jgi:hypothetical protein